MRPPWWLPVVLALGCQPEDPPDQVQPLDPVDPEWIGSGDEPSEILFDPVSIPDLHIELSEDALAALQNDPHDYTEGVFTFDERVFEPIGVRLMGVDPALGSDHKPSFKLKFDESVASGEFLGLRELQLREMAADASMMRERLGYMVFREAGVPASRAHHARVFVNGECYGLYANVENVDRRLVGRWLHAFVDDGLVAVHLAGSFPAGEDDACMWRLGGQVQLLRLSDNTVEPAGVFQVRGAANHLSLADGRLLIVSEERAAQVTVENPQEDVDRATLVLKRYVYQHALAGDDVLVQLSADSWNPYLIRLDTSPIEDPSSVVPLGRLEITARRPEERILPAELQCESPGTGLGSIALLAKEGLAVLVLRRPIAGPVPESATTVATVDLSDPASPRHLASVDS